MTKKEVTRITKKLIGNTIKVKFSNLEYGEVWLRPDIIIYPNWIDEADPINALFTIAHESAHIVSRDLYHLDRFVATEKRLLTKLGFERIRRGISEEIYSFVFGGTKYVQDKTKRALWYIEK